MNQIYSKTWQLPQFENIYEIHSCPANRTYHWLNDPLTIFPRLAYPHVNFVDLQLLARNPQPNQVEVSTYELQNNSCFPRTNIINLHNIIDFPTPNAFNRRRAWSDGLPWNSQHTGLAGHARTVILDTVSVPITRNYSSTTPFLTNLLSIGKDLHFTSLFDSHGHYFNSNSNL